MYGHPDEPVLSVVSCIARNIGRDNRVVSNMYAVLNIIADVVAPSNMLVPRRSTSLLEDALDENTTIGTAERRRSRL